MVGAGGKRVCRSQGGEGVIMMMICGSTGIQQSCCMGGF